MVRRAPQLKQRVNCPKEDDDDHVELMEWQSPWPFLSAADGKLGCLFKQRFCARVGSECLNVSVEASHRSC